MFNKPDFDKLINSATQTQVTQFNLLLDRLDTIINLLTVQVSDQQVIIQKENTLMATIQDVQTAVSNQSTVEDSVVTLLNGINQQLKDAIASNNPAALDAVVASITTNTTKLSDAVTANTPVTPTPATVTVVTPTA
jgi:hypothetical protein